MNQIIASKARGFQRYPNDGCGDCCGRHEGVGASVVAGVDAPPVFQSSEHDLDFMALSVEDGAVRDTGFAV